MSGSVKKRSITGVGSGLLAFALVLSLTGCTDWNQVPTLVSVPPPNAQIVVSTPVVDERRDMSCAYFYFLWGTHAESNKKYSESQEAYEKALICDPDAEFVLKKLPILLLKMGKQHAATEWLREAVAKKPGDIDSQLLLARLNVTTGDIEGAIKIYEKILEIAPDNSTVRLRLGYLYSQQGRYKEGEETIKVLLSKDPESYFVLLSLARLAVQSADYDTASTLYEKILTLNWSAELVYEMAEFYGLRGQYKRVEQLYASILNKEPENEQAAMGRIHALILDGQEKNALSELAKTRLFSKNPINIDLIASRIHIRIREFSKANVLLEKILVKSRLAAELSAARYMLAVVRYEANKKEAALAHLRKIHPDDEEFVSGIALQVKILSELKRHAEAINILQKLIDKPARRQALYYNLLANMFVQQGQMAAGEETLHKGVALYPDNVQLHFEYGLLLEQEKRQVEAIATMEKVIVLQSDHVEALNYLGYTWANSNINLDKALEYIKKANEIKPDNGFIVDSLGWVYFRLGDVGRAKVEMERAVLLEPKDPHILDHLGDIYQADKQTEKARNVWRKAKSLFKEQEEKEQMQNKIDDSKE